MIFTAGLKRTSIFAATIVLSLAATATANAACSDPAAPNVDWSGCDKERASLKNADLSGANLTGADLSDTDLANAILTSADLTNADLRRADLTSTNLSGATWIDGRICAWRSFRVCK